MSPNGRRAYVASISGFVSVINTRTNAVVATIDVGTQPQGVAVSRDGRLAYVTSTPGPVGKVTVIGTRTNAVLTTIDVGVAPFAVALTPHRCSSR